MENSDKNTNENVTDNTNVASCDVSVGSLDKEVSIVDLRDELGIIDAPSEAETEQASVEGDNTNNDENYTQVDVNVEPSEADAFVPSQEDLASLAEQAQELAKIEPVAGDQVEEIEEPSSAAAQRVAEIEPDLGTPTPPTSSGNASGGGYGFQSSFDAQGVLSLTDVGPIDPTKLQYGIDNRNDELFAFEEALPPLNPVLEFGEYRVYEDGDVRVAVFAAPETEDGDITFTISGIPTGWSVTDEAFDAGNAPVGTGVFDSAAGTWTITLTNGAVFDGGPIFSPPADSDVDALDLVFTVSEVNPAEQSGTTSGTSFITVDAVADDPDIDAQDDMGLEGATLDIDIAALTGEEVNNGTGSDDGSESITGYQISGVPAGFTLSAGTETFPGSGIYNLTSAEIVGLQITPNDPTYFGSIDLVATVFTTENTPTDTDFDFTNNNAQDSDQFSLTWKPLANPPCVKVNQGVDDALVKEDSSVDVPIVATLDPAGSGNEILTVTVTGIDSSWGFSAPVGTYDSAAGTWTITLPAGQDLSTVFTFTPPADSDIDMTGLQAIASAYEPATNTTANAAPDDFQIITDAVADDPDIDAANDTGLEGVVLDIDISALTGEEVNNGAGMDDSSESIAGYQISGVPAGFTLSAGSETFPGSGVYNLTPAEIVGLQITPPNSNYFGTLNLTATVFTTENPVSDGEFDLTDNNAQDSDGFSLTWNPVINPPCIKVNNGVDDALVKEDNSIDVPITAQLGADPAAGEYLTVTVTGIDPSWGTFTSTIGTYDSGTGTWTITLGAGESLDTVFNFAPNADSDIDLTGLVATVVATDPAASLTASANDGFNVIVDAVADIPNLDADKASGEEGTVIALNITTSVNDTDGSEVIEVIKIGNLPAGTSLTAGTYNAVDDVWELSPADLVGLGLNVPDGVTGNFELTVESVAYEQNTNGTEVDLTDNRASAFDVIEVCVEEDHIPVIKGDEVTVDETDLSPTTFVSSNVSADFGNDAPGTIEGNGTFLIGNITSGGTPVTVTFDAPTNTYTGMAGAETIFTLVIQSNGDYTFTLEGVLDHPDVTDHNDSLPLEFGVKATDSDNDVANAVITVNVLDDGPYIHNKFAKVDETDLDSGPIGYTRTLDFDFGEDGAGSIDPTGNFTATFQVGGSNQPLTSGGVAIDVTTTADGYVGMAGGETIFTLTLNSQSGEYTYTQFKTIDHPDETNHDDVIWLKFEVEITDADGDTDTAIIGVDVHDDGPVIHDKFARVDETDLENGPIGYTKTLNFDFGEDGAGTIEPTGDFVAKFQVGGPDVQLTSGGLAIDVVAIADGYVGTAGGVIVFTLTLDSQSGEYTYTQFKTIDHPDETNHDDVIWLKFEVEITDADGDTDTAIIGVDVHDDGPVAHDDCIEFNASEGSYSANVVDNDDLSQDADNTVTQIKFDGDVFDVPTDGSDIVINGEFGALTINNTGTYTYDPFDTAFSSGGSDALNPEASDVAGTQSSITKNGITVEIANAGNFDISWVNTNDGSGLGIDNLNSGDSPKVWPTGETFDVSFDQSAQSVTLTIAELGSNNDFGQHGVDYVVTLADGTEVIGEQQFVPGEIVDGHFTFTLDASDFGGQTIASIELNSTNDGQYKGASFLLNNVEVEYPHLECVQDNFEYVLTDADGDTDVAVLKIKTFAPDDVLIVGQNVNDDADSDTPHLVNGDEGVIDGGAGNDILVGDAGGSFLEQQTQDYNFVFILDISGSMGSASDANSKISLLKVAVANLLTEMSAYDGGDVKVHIVPFATTSSQAETFTLTNAADLANLVSYLDGLTLGGYTNYELPMQDAVEWLESDEPLGGNAITTTYFISDGAPNRYVNDLGQRTAGNAALVMDEITGSDGTDEVSALQTLSDEVIAVGIDIGTNISNLHVIDSDGSALNIDDPSDLTVVLAGTSPLDKLLAAGDDVIEGGEGNDIIFGDVLFTDDLSTLHGLGVDDASGWEVFERLENGESTVDAGWSRDDTIAYIRSNAQDLSQESVNSEGDGRDGGDDVINGGAGNDLIFGQEGNDIIAGGLGEDVIYGGSGADIFLFEAISEGVDTVKDFDLTEGDLVDLSALLSGYDALTDDIADFVIATEAGGNTTLFVDQAGNTGFGGSVELVILEGVTGLDLDASIKTDTVIV